MTETSKDAGFQFRQPVLEPRLKHRLPPRQRTRLGLHTANNQKRVLLQNFLSRHVRQKPVEVKLIRASTHPCVNESRHGNFHGEPLVHLHRTANPSCGIYTLPFSRTKSKVLLSTKKAPHEGGAWRIRILPLYCFAGGGEAWGLDCCCGGWWRTPVKPANIFMSISSSGHDGIL